MNMRQLCDSWNNLSIETAQNECRDQQTNCCNQFHRHNGSFLYCNFCSANIYVYTIRYIYSDTDISMVSRNCMWVLEYPFHSVFSVINKNRLIMKLFNNRKRDTTYLADKSIYCGWFSHSMTAAFHLLWLNLWHQEKGLCTGNYSANILYR